MDVTMRDEILNSLFEKPWEEKKALLSTFSWSHTFHCSTVAERENYFKEFKNIARELSVHYTASQPENTLSLSLQIALSPRNYESKISPCVYHYQGGGSPYARRLFNSKLKTTQMQIENAQPFSSPSGTPTRASGNLPHMIGAFIA